MWTVIFSVLIWFNIFYLISRTKNDFSVVDIAWGLSFLLIFVIAGITFNSSWEAREVLVGSLVLIWSVRLSGYIFFRSRKIGKEDYRYAQFRKDWGENANTIAYFRVFILQAFLSLLIASPLHLGSQGGIQNDC